MNEDDQKNNIKSFVSIKNKLHSGLGEKFPIDQNLNQMYLETFITFQNHKKMTNNRKENYLQVNNQDGFVVIDSMLKSNQR